MVKLGLINQNNIKQLLLRKYNLLRRRAATALCNKAAKQQKSMGGSLQIVFKHILIAETQKLMEWPKQNQCTRESCKQLRQEKERKEPSSSNLSVLLIMQKTAGSRQIFHRQPIGFRSPECDDRYMSPSSSSSLSYTIIIGIK